MITTATRSFFSEGNNVSFSEKYSKSEKCWGFDNLCMRSPWVRGSVLMRRYAPY